MRSAILGACFDDDAKLRTFVEASTCLTHTDPKTFFGAMAVAVATRCAIEGTSNQQFPGRLRSALPEPEAAELHERLEDAITSADGAESTPAFATERCGAKGVSGYVYQTVPVAIHAWARHRNDYRSAVKAAIECGGDTDTVGAIVGGIIGASVGPEGIPDDWRRGLLEWPRSTNWIERLADATDASVTQNRPIAPPRVGPLVLLRNIFFGFIVLAHIARRMLPPY
jgi:ADP-ribosylglycohydrolase